MDRGFFLCVLYWMFGLMNTDINYTSYYFFKLRINLVEYSLKVYFVQDISATVIQNVTSF